MLTSITAYLEVFIVCIIKFITGSLFYYIFHIDLNHNIKIYNVPRMIICNHQTYYDIFTLLYIFEKGNKTLAIKKKKVQYFNEIYNNICGMIIYEIGNLNSGKRVKNKMIEEFNKGNNVIVFPEGKTNNSKISKFKLGSFKTCYDNNIPIQLLCLKVPDKNFRIDESNNYVKVTIIEILQKIMSNKTMIYYDDYELIYPSSYDTFEKFMNEINRKYYQYDTKYEIYK